MIATISKINQIVEYLCIIFSTAPADSTQERAPVLDSSQAALFDPYKKPAENNAVMASFGLEAKEGNNDFAEYIIIGKCLKKLNDACETHETTMSSIHCNALIAIISLLTYKSDCDHNTAEYHQMQLLHSGWESTHRRSITIT